MADQIPYIRVFISSPGDVNAERKIALDSIEFFPNRPAYREKVAFRVVAWDKPGAGTAMLGTLSPQEAINRGLPKPSECDLVIVIFWSRMGTPFTDTDGKNYLSGTHWELLDALDSKTTETVIFRRTEEKLFKSSDKAGQEQNERVRSFFESELFYREDGSIVRGVNSYETPDAFRRDFEIFFEEQVVRLLRDYDTGKTALPPQPPEANTKQATSEVGTVATVEAQIWTGSPFPGLRAFTEEDAPIFFGRGLEINGLLTQVDRSRFVAVVGASGSGKSSLVSAGLIPTLKANGIIGSRDWLYARFTPGTGNNPFEALVASLMAVLPALGVDDPFEHAEKVEQRAQRLLDKPDHLAGILNHALKDAPDHVLVMVFIDQFEELFTLANADYVKPFAAMLAGAKDCDRLRIVVTMRHDFYHKAIEVPDLAELLRADAVFSLSIPRRDALREMIERPAERAGLEMDAELTYKILDDVGNEAGNLALMAYALDELYHSVDDDKRLTVKAYNALGGVEGAIGERAESTYDKLKLDGKEQILQQVFRELVAVDERGTATRQRANLNKFSETQGKLINAFVTARLLVTHDNSLEVAHEAIFRSWERLVDWIESAQEDLILLRQVKTAAAEWHRRGEDYLRWNHERLELVYAMAERLQPDLSETEQSFIEPEQERLYREIEEISTSHQRRYDIGERLSRIGDTRDGIGVKEGKPDVLWLPVNGSAGKYTFKDEDNNVFGEFEVSDFFISKYLTTKAQLDAFLESDWDNPKWWQDFPERYQPQSFGNVTNGNNNAPRDTVSWYQSVAFGRWMTEQFKGLKLEHPSGEVLRVGDNTQIRIPTEWEWQWVAMNGTDERDYPWGAWDEHPRANTTEAGIQDRSTAVGMYPDGVAKCDALDMSGNLWEWCANNKDEPEIIDASNTSFKVLRGGAFNNVQPFARSSYRFDSDPDFDDNNCGLRLVVAPILRL